MYGSHENDFCAKLSKPCLLDLLVQRNKGSSSKALSRHLVAEGPSDGWYGLMVKPLMFTNRTSGVSVYYCFYNYNFEIIIDWLYTGSTSASYCVYCSTIIVYYTVRETSLVASSLQFVIWRLCKCRRVRSTCVVYVVYSYVVNVIKRSCYVLD